MTSETAPYQRLRQYRKKILASLYIDPPHNQYIVILLTYNTLDGALCDAIFGTSYFKSGAISFVETNEFWLIADSLVVASDQ